jgi:hypothetical protein
MECLICIEDCQDGPLVTAYLVVTEMASSYNCTCPTCRFELPTDDLEYEEERKQRMKERRLIAQDEGTSLTMISSPDTGQWCMPDGIDQLETQHHHGSMATFVDESSNDLFSFNWDEDDRSYCLASFGNVLET